MNLWNKITQRWHPLSISLKFTLGGSFLLCLIVIVAATGYISLVNVRKAENSILTSYEIQRLVLNMDRNMEKARRLYGDFVLQYPIIGFEDAHQQYAQPAIRQIALVITTSKSLKNLIEQSHVSLELQTSDIDLNLYLSSAKRFSKTAIESIELIAQLSVPERGFEAQLVSALISLQKEINGHQNLIFLYHEIRSYTQKYRIARKRFLMQSAINVSFRFNQQLEAQTELDAQKKEKITALLDQSLSIMEKILVVDVRVKSIINDFSLQEKIVDPISRSLITLSMEEVKQEKQKISNTHNLMVILMIGIGLFGLFTAIIIGKVLHSSITQRIVRLTKTAKELRKGNLEVFVDEGSGDEIGQLAITFNIMAGRIKELVENLESKVEQRTFELKESNEKLLGEIEDRKKAENERERLEIELRQVHKMEAIGTLAGGIAHDFNNILAALIGYADMARDYIPEGNPAKLQVEEILKAGNRAKNLVKQILAFSRKSQLGRVPVQIAKIVNETVHLLRASIPSTIEIRLNIDSECGSVLADKTQIHQVILNLCTNAAQSMEKEGGILDISLISMEIDEAQISGYKDLKPGSHVKLTVKDTGSGINKKVIDKIFDPYFTTKEIGKGSGMGLAVVHGIVKSHKGMILVKSRPGIGSVFQIYLPGIDDEIIIHEQSPEPLLTGTEHILFVDDDEAIAEISQLRLESLGYKVTSKTNSPEALELFSQNPGDFDIVITDQTMPHMTGEKMAKKMIAIQNDIPIILSSGYSSTIDGDMAKKMGIRAFLMKPASIEELSGCIRRVLDEEKK